MAHNGANPLSNLLVLTLLLLLVSLSRGFTSLTIHHGKERTSAAGLRLSNDNVEALSVPITQDESTVMKRQLLNLGASFDRGYGASPSARKQVERVIESLEQLNVERFAARGIEGDESSPLAGSWRMIWTSAQDVLVLGASPIATVGSIYQVFDPPVVTNVIDFIPKAQALLPLSLVPSTLVRAEVATRASVRSNMPMRVGLNFEAVKLKAVEVLGMEADFLPPFGFNLPQIPGADSESSPGYFDVTYLDDEVLIIRQNAPGGLFAFIKTDNYDP